MTERQQPPLLRLTTLGRLALVKTNGEPEPLLSGVKPLAIPAVLAMLPGYAADRGYLAELIWSGDAKRARASLRQALHHLTRFGMGAGVEAREDRVWLTPSLIEIDLIELERAVRSRDYDRVIDLYTGPFLKDLVSKVSRELARSIDAQGDRIQIALDIAYPRVIESRLEAGAFADAIRLAHNFAGENPLSEKAQVTLIGALRTGGQPERALQTYEGYRSLLESELGGTLDPVAFESVRRVSEELTREPEAMRLVFVPEPVKGTVEAEDDALERRSMRRSLFAAWSVTGALVIWLTFLLWPADPWPSGATLHLPLNVGRNGNVTLSVSVRGTTAGPEEAPRHLAGAVYWGDRFATAINVQNGVDLWADLDDGRGLRPVRSRPADEEPMAWGPHGVRLLFHAGRSDALGRYHEHIGWIDLRDGSEHRLGDIEGDPAVAASWSPDVSVIAIHVRQAQFGTDSLLIVNPRGDRLAAVGGLAAAAPSWSPSSKRVVFVARGENGGDPSIRSVNRNGEDPITEVSLPGRLTAPVWLTDNLILFVADFGLGGDVWVVDRRGGWHGRVSDLGDVQGIRVSELQRDNLAWLDSVPPTRWATAVERPEELGSLETLTLRPEVQPVIGEYFQVSTPATWRGGRPGVVEPSALQWHGSAQIEQVEAGLFRARSVGRHSLRADFNGWYQAEVGIDVSHGPLPSPEARVLLETDWSDQEQVSQDWAVVGDPAPIVERDGGRNGGAFRNNGDANYSNGALSIMRFPLGEGLTLEVEGLVPFEEGIFQGFILGLAEHLPAPDSTSNMWSPEGIFVRLSRNAKTHVVTGGTSSYSPLPDDLRTWRTYSLQVEPTGWITLLVDGRVHTRKQVERAELPPGPFHVQVGGSSLNTDIRHGHLRLYRGIRYPLTHLPPGGPDR